MQIISIVYRLPKIKVELKRSQIQYLLPNSAYGKFIECPFNYESSKFVFTRKGYEKMLDSSRFKSAVFHNYGVLMKSKPPDVTLNKPIQLGWSILCRSKLVIMEAYYSYMLPTYMKIVKNPLDDETSLRILYHDTDSLVIRTSLSCEEELLFYNELSDLFDFSNLPKTDK